MTNMFLSFLEISIPVSIMIAVLLLLTSFLNKRYAAKWKYWIWIVLALRLIIPLGASSWPPVADMQSQRGIPTLSESEKAPSDALADGTTFGQIMIEIPAQMTTPVVMQSEKAGSNISVLDIIALIWMLGSLLFISVHLFSYFHYRHQILKRGGIVKDKDVLYLLVKLKRELHIRCTVSVIEYSEVASPMMIGFFNRVLVLPEGQCDMGKSNFQGKGNSRRKGYSQEELYFILKHELIHLKRKDIYFKLLFVAAHAIHWFNPMVWILQKEAAVDMELSCDEQVTQGADYATRKAYTETLLSTLHKQNAKGTVLSTGFYGGKQIMKKRFTNILAKTKKKNGAAVLICIILLAVSLGTLVGCSITKENTGDAPGQSETEDSESKGVLDESSQTEEPLSESGNHPSEAEDATGNSPAEATPSSADKETQTTPSSAEEETQNAETEDELIFDNPYFLEDYYNTPEGKAAIEADFADLVGEGMTMAISVIMDEIIVTVKYEDSALLTEGIGETLAQQLESMTDRFWKQTIAYDELITWRCVLRVIYVDPEGNVLAEQGYSAE